MNDNDDDVQIWWDDDEMARGWSMMRWRDDDRWWDGERMIDDETARGWLMTTCKYGEMMMRWKQKEDERWWWDDERINDDDVQIWWDDERLNCNNVTIKPYKHGSNISQHVVTMYVQLDSDRMTRIQSVTLTFTPLTKNSVHENRSRRGWIYGEGEGGLPETKWFTPSLRHHLPNVCRVR